MRIISQNETYSFEFDRHDVRRQSNYIYVVGNSRDIVIGQYDTELRAKQIFADLHYEAEKEMRKLPEMTLYQMPKN